MTKASKLSKMLNACDSDEFAQYELDLIQRAEESDHDTDGYFHPSSISGGCKRRLLYPYIVDKKGAPLYVPSATAKNPCTERVWENGTFAHIRTQLGLVHAGDVLRRKVMSKDMQTYMEEMYQDYFKRPGEIMTDLWLFAREYFCIEVSMLDDEDNVKGSCDAILIKNGIIKMLEFKTWNSFAWAKLNESEYAHKVQATTYIHYLKKTYKGKIFYDSAWNKFTLDKLAEALFWYENKDDQNMKRYVLQYDLPLATRIVSMCRSAKEFKAKNVLPEKKFNDNRKKPCSWCKYKSICYKKGI